MFLLEVIAKPGAAQSAIAFPAQKLGRHPTIFAGREEPNELGAGFDIFFHAPELFTLLSLRRAASARSHRIDEDQVGRIQHGERIVADLPRHFWLFPIGWKVDLLRSQASEVQPNG